MGMMLVKALNNGLGSS